MATINTIADEISGALDRPFDEMFKARVKSVFRHTAALVIRQEINKSKIHSSFKTRFNTDIEELPDKITINGNQINVFKTINKVLTPIRYTTDEPFTFVGTITGDTVYIYTNINELYYTGVFDINIPCEDSSDHNPIRYVYQNGYIYIYNLPIIEGDPTQNQLKVSIEGVYPTNYIITPEDTLNKLEITDDTTLILSDDLIQIIKDYMFKTDFVMIDNQDKVKPANIDNN